VPAFKGWSSVPRRVASLSSLLILAYLITGTATAHAACGAGTVLYTRDGDTTWLLLADHVHWFQRNRGWAAFGGLCDDDTPQEAAARETEEETRGFFARAAIRERIEEAKRLRTGDYYTWFVEVDHIPAEQITQHTPPRQQSSYYERGPFTWVPLNVIWQSIDQHYPGRVWLPSQYLPQRRNTSWLHDAFVASMITARKNHLLPEQ
jgi:8-oxo-dGTP pyrophosphatase MutT (NUDIX family)